MAVVIAVVGASTKIASCALETGETMASSIVAITLAVAVILANQKRAVESSEALTTSAGQVNSTNTVSIAIIGADTSLALNTRITRLAKTDAVFACTMLIAIAGAGSQTAITPSPAILATAGAIETNSVTSAVRRAGSE